MREDDKIKSVPRFRKVAAADVGAIRKRGGALRTLLGPATVGATTGFMGLATLEPGEYVSEHYHPYSEEFLFLMTGEITVRLDGELVWLSAREGLVVPVNVRHRLANEGGVAAEVIYHLAPLAPRPDLGHVDTEPYPVGDRVSAGEAP
jgi:putative monooxygenase